MPLYSPIATQIDHHLTHHGPQQNSHDLTAIGNHRDRLPAAFDSELRTRPQHLLARAAVMGGKRAMRSPKPKGSIAKAMSAEKDWKKEQVNRLEIEREKELLERDTWFQSKKAKGLKKAKKAEDAAVSWSSSSWWWEDGENWHDQDWHKQEEASWEPALHAEPGAHGDAPEPSARAAGSSDNPWETVTPEEDKRKLRAATLTPAGFAPQRCVTMALGRPVVVLRELASAVSYHTCSVSEVHEQQPCVFVFFSEMKLVCMAEINRLR